jgi:Tol biopolymer transport system component
MTQGGCCVQPFFSPDGSRVVYLDKPSPGDPTGLWSVPVAQPMAAPALFSEHIGPFNADMSLFTFLRNRQTVVQRVSDGQQWVIQNGGRRPVFAPDSSQIAWEVEEEVGGFDVRRSDVWLANVDGSAAKQIATFYGGGIVAWFRDSARMLVSGKLKRADITPTLGILTLADGALQPLGQVDRARGQLLSPDGARLAYYVAQSRDPAQDGMYLLDLTANQPQRQRLDFFGAYRWCPARPSRLLYIPLKPGSPSNELWALDTATGQSEQIIAAQEGSPFKIANGDWDVSPDGRHITYTSARDSNIWLVTLRDGC